MVVENTEADVATLAEQAGKKIGLWRGFVVRPDVTSEIVLNGIGVLTEAARKLRAANVGNTDASSMLDELKQNLVIFDRVRLIKEATDAVDPSGKLLSDLEHQDLKRLIEIEETFSSLLFDLSDLGKNFDNYFLTSPSSIANEIRLKMQGASPMLIADLCSQINNSQKKLLELISKKAMLEWKTFSEVVALEADLARLTGLRASDILTTWDNNGVDLGDIQNEIIGLKVQLQALTIKIDADQLKNYYRDFLTEVSSRANAQIDLLEDYAARAYGRVQLGGGRVFSESQRSLLERDEATLGFPPSKFLIDFLLRRQQLYNKALTPVILDVAYKDVPGWRLIGELFKNFFDLTNNGLNIELLDLDFLLLKNVEGLLGNSSLIDELAKTKQSKLWPIIGAVLSEVWKTLLVDRDYGAVASAWGDAGHMVYTCYERLWKNDSEFLDKFQEIIADELGGDTSADSHINFSSVGENSTSLREELKNVTILFAWLFATLLNMRQDAASMLLLYGSSPRTLLPPFSDMTEASRIVSVGGYQVQKKRVAPPSLGSIDLLGIRSEWGNPDPKTRTFLQVARVKMLYFLESWFGHKEAGKLWDEVKYKPLDPFSLHLLTETGMLRYFMLGSGTPSARNLNFEAIKTVGLGLKNLVNAAQDCFVSSIDNKVWSDGDPNQIEAVLIDRLGKITTGLGQASLLYDNLPVGPITYTTVIKESVGIDSSTGQPMLDSSGNMILKPDLVERSVNLRESLYDLLYSLIGTIIISIFLDIPFKGSFNDFFYEKMFDLVKKNIIKILNSSGLNSIKNENGVGLIDKLNQVVDDPRLKKEARMLVSDDTRQTRLKKKMKKKVTILESNNYPPTNSNSGSVGTFFNLARSRVIAAVNEVIEGETPQQTAAKKLRLTFPFSDASVASQARAEAKGG